MGRFLAVPVALLLAISVVAPAVADDPYVFDAGVACEFPLGFSGTDASPTNYREFTDGSGTVTWSVMSGRGGTMTLVNMATGASMTIGATGASMTIGATGASARTYYRSDGSSWNELTGGWVLIMFPTDDPAGPSTTQVLGRIVYDMSADWVTTLKSVSGRQVDICAALS